MFMHMPTGQQLATNDISLLHIVWILALFEIRYNNKHGKWHPATIDWVKVLRSTRHQICNFRDVLPSQSLGLVLKNWNKHNKSKHASVTKYTMT